MLPQVLCVERRFGALLKVESQNLLTVSKISARLSPQSGGGAGDKGSPTPATLIAAHCCHSSRTADAALPFRFVVFQQDRSLE